MKLLKKIGIAMALVGFASTLAIMLYTTSWASGVDFTLVFLYLWALLPYIVLLVLTLQIHRKAASDESRIAIFIATVAVVFLSVLSYYHAMFVSVSSTSALVFVVIPLYALTAIGVFYFVSWLLIKLRRRESS